MAILNPAKIIFASALTLALTACGSSNEKKVGVIVPFEHQAMTEIVKGFKETLNKNSKMPVRIKVANALGDINTQRAIIQQMKDENYDVIAPIGLATTQMTVSTVRNIPIVSIASSFSQSDRKKLKPCNLAVVYDEISPLQMISFIHTVYPNIKNITLIHSASEKVFPEVKESIIAGKKFDITVKPLMVTALNELYTIANSLPENTQAIFILKDSMIVSGINTLAAIAEKKQIPLITSDEGSVEQNAAFALGVPEKEIGEKAGVLAADILSGKKSCDLPIVVMKELTVFANEAALKKENQPISNIVNSATKLKYKINMVNIKDVN